MPSRADPSTATLLDRLTDGDRDRNGEGVAILTPDGRLTHAALADRAAGLSARARGRRIALIGGDVAQAAILLAAADGQAEAVALISPAQPPGAIARQLDLAGADCALIAKGAAPLPGLCGAATAKEVLAASGPAIDATPPAQADRVQTGWLMTTSGTTGGPRMVRHSLAGLTRTTRARALQQAQPPVWGLMYDHTRFAGLQVLLQSLLSGACLAAPDLTMPLTGQLAFLQNAGCTHLSATPTLWRKILMTPGAQDLALTQITLGGEIADNALLTALSQRFPAARISHIFASTEAGVAFSVRDGLAGFPASYLTDPPSGIALQIRDGRLWVRNDHVQPAYLGHAGSFGTGGWIDTGDTILQAQDRVLFRGRNSGIINVGGSKVHPEEVERVLLTHPQVAAARVFARPNPIIGALVAAEVVPVPDADPAALRADLMAHLHARLDRHAVPAILTITAALHVSGAGKVQRGD